MGAFYDDALGEADLLALEMLTLASPSLVLAADYSATETSIHAVHLSLDDGTPFYGPVRQRGAQ